VSRPKAIYHENDGQTSFSVAQLPDGTWIGWGPWAKDDEYRQLSESEIEYYGVRRLKTCPMCGHTEHAP
jgi:hypothetical protein